MAIDIVLERARRAVVLRDLDLGAGRSNRPVATTVSRITRAALAIGSPSSGIVRAGFAHRANGQDRASRTRDVALSIATSTSTTRRISKWSATAATGRLSASRTSMATRWESGGARRASGGGGTARAASAPSAARRAAGSGRWRTGCRRSSRPGWKPGCRRRSVPRAASGRRSRCAVWRPARSAATATPR